MLSSLALIASLGLSACGTSLPTPTLSERSGKLERLSATAAIFPLSRYDQDVDRWIDPHDPAYHSALLDTQSQARELARLIQFYFGSPNRADHGNGNSPQVDEASRSPWDPVFLQSINNAAGRAETTALIQRNVWRYGPNGPRPGYGPNLRPYRADWIVPISNNIDSDVFKQAPSFDAARRAITVDNTLLRLLPTSDPFFYDPRLAGEGYPFDNLQETALRPGTPVYVLGQTRDKLWSYVLAPDVSGWVEAKNLARVDEAFISRWRSAAYTSLGAIIGAHVVVSDRTGHARFDAPIGTVLPLVGPHTVMMPVRDLNDQAQIREADLPESAVTAMPYAATPAHFAVLLRALMGRPYGWGGTGFYNDCSLDLKSLFTPFGIWLPRHSSAQVVQPEMVDLSEYTTAERIAYLRRYGRPFLTLIGLPGHVMLYLGNSRIDRDGQDGAHETVPMVYEALWGLSPADGSRRAIVGQSVILPLLASFPEDPKLASQAGKSQFRLGFLASKDRGDAGTGQTANLAPTPAEIQQDSQTAEDK